MRREKRILVFLITLVLTFLMTACGKNDVTSSSEGVNEDNTTAGNLQVEEIADGSKTSDAWKKGKISVNGTVYNLSEITLEQFCTSGYQSDKQNDILSVEKVQQITMSDGKHQDITIRCSNFSDEKPLYAKHAVITGYRIDLTVGNGLEAVDVTLPGNIKGGMSKEEITAVMGVPDSNSNEDNLYYNYEENDKVIYRLSFYLDHTTHKLHEVDYRNEQEYANKSDDSEEINRSLETTVESAKVSKSKVSDSLKDAEIKIGKQVYKMPLNMQDLIELGYEDDSDGLQLVMNSKQRGGNARLSDKGENCFFVEEFENLSEKPRALSHCWISELAFTKSAEKVSIAKGIKIGSSYDEVVSAFGKVEKQDYSSTYWMNYSYSAKRGKVEVSINLDKKTNKVRQINIMVSQLDK